MTTTGDDREMLELAAKAGNVNIDPDRYDTEWGFAVRGTSTWWNPCTNDGDALRLGVKTNVIGSPLFHHYRALERFAHQDHDDLFATRRAIVLAAAEIGRAM